MAGSLHVRDATEADVPFLWRMLTHAASMSLPGSEAAVEEARANPDLVFYAADFGRPSDLGVIAERDGRPCGAAWLRLLLAGASAVNHVATDIEPELAIAVEPDARGRGVGGQLLDALVDRARGRCPAIVLSVREGNPSIRLYERAGFRVVTRIVNRVGGVSLVMRLQL